MFLFLKHDKCNVFMQTVNLNGFFINSFDMNKINNFVYRKHWKRCKSSKQKKVYSIFNLNCIDFYWSYIICYLYLITSFYNSIVLIDYLNSFRRTFLTINNVVLALAIIFVIIPLRTWILLFGSTRCSPPYKHLTAQCVLNRYLNCD